MLLEYAGHKVKFVQNTFIMINKVLSIVFILFISLFSFAQTDTAAPFVPKDYKNVVRWNLTPTAVLGFGSWAFGYERVLNDYRSFSVNVGFIQMPRFFSTTLDSLRIDRNSERYGFSLAADYRFYFKSRNLHNAPDGLYWGPYFAGYYFNTKTSVLIFENGQASGNIDVNSELAFLMGGIELGYQFTLGEKKRWTIDLILVGPSIRYDIINIKLGASLDGEIKNEYYQGIYDALTSFIPGLKELSSEKEISTSGFTSGFGAGYRYVMQIGYRF